MKQCPACNRTYTDDALLFCLEDGSQLQSTASTAETLISYDSNADPNKTLAFTPARETSPPPTNLYPSAPPPAAAPPSGQTPPTPSWRHTPPQYTPAPSVGSAPKAGGRGWIIGGIVAVLVLGIGIVVLLAVIGRDNSTSTANSNTSPTAANKSSNTGGGSTTDNANRTGVPPSSNFLKDDFSKENWPVGDAAYGSFYEDGEYHMKGRPGLYVFMFPRSSAGYMSKDAVVKVTARSVGGRSPNHGYGLIIHGRISQQKNLEGYGFLIYTDSPAKYRIVRFVEGVPKEEVNWTASSAIRSSTSPNQIEVRAHGSLLYLYVNGQFVNSITDAAGFTEGFVGLYTSETNEVAFDDMEINRDPSAFAPPAAK